MRVKPSKEKSKTTYFIDIKKPNSSQQHIKLTKVMTNNLSKTPIQAKAKTSLRFMIKTFLSNNP